MNQQVVIIGAGPAGTLAALLLARRGRDVLLVDRKPLGRYKVCGGCLSASGVDILASAGVLDAVMRRGAQPLQRLNLQAAGRTSCIDLPTGLSLSRGALDQSLVEQAIDAGVTFLPDTHAEVHDGERYQVTLRPMQGEDEATIVQADVIIVADGLGHPSLHHLPRFTQQVSPSSRIGAGCILPHRVDWVHPNAISMIVGREGYVGLVEVEDGHTCVAAALDASFVRRHAGLEAACASLLTDTGLSVAWSPEEVKWFGTPALTRTTLCHADRNVYLLGDASGYVEPFTGEGMTWALSSAVEVVPYIEQAVTGVARPGDWDQHVKQVQRRRHTWCRAITAGLRSPWMLAASMRLLKTAPFLAQPWVQGIAHRPIPALAKAIP